MSMREKDAGEILKACTGLQDLALRPFTAIDQKAVFIMFDDLGGESAFGGGGRGGRAKKKYFEQNGILCDRKLVTRHPGVARHRYSYRNFTRPNIVSTVWHENHRRGKRKTDHLCYTLDYR